MDKNKSLYICQSCAFESTRWLGQCTKCGEWNSFVETVAASGKVSNSLNRGGKKHFSQVQPVLLSKTVSKVQARVSLGTPEFDRVLGGGLVPGQVVLLAGEPGIGKSTILTQISKSLDNKYVLYVCGEESAEQIKVRTNRMNYKAENLLVLPETNVDVITSVIEQTKDLSLVVVDSVQTLFSEDLTGMAGSVGQVKGGAQKLTSVAKSSSTPLIIVGHVTKEGTVAGPKVLEHIVDTVLYLEGDSQNMFRILKTTKNRFGPVSEIGIFEMTGEGMTEVKNPSQLFISERLESSSGSCITVVMEGYRPLLFEIQALTVKTNFGYPRRTTTGFSTSRLQVLIAILEKRCGLNLSSYDVYLSVAGGFKVSEHACDLAVCLAITSSLKDRPLGAKVVAFGECGLGGEIRRVSFQDKRVLEAKRLGYTKVLSPESVKTIIQAVKTLV